MLDVGGIACEACAADDGARSIVAGVSTEV
jgi:hypothetical protein